MAETAALSLQGRVRPWALLLALAAAAACPPALAQWQWIDGNGRRVFSDRPPPPEVAQRQILQQPAPVAPPLVVTGPAASQAVSTASVPVPVPSEPARAAASTPRTAASAAQDARRQQAEAERRRAEQDRVARLRADNCARARSAKATLDAGVRLTRTNEKGEREILDDAARAAESRRLQDIIASDC